MQNPEYHATVEEQVRWLEQTELDIQHMEPVDVADGLDVIESKYNNFKVFRFFYQNIHFSVTLCNILVIGFTLCYFKNHYTPMFFFLF